MATLIPPEPADQVKSSAERQLFKVFTGLPDYWTVLHSVGLARHKRKRWAEADFVLVGPSGVYVIEVKGGRLGYESGKWTFIDRNDRSTTKGEGPFEQAGTAAATLNSYLRDQRDRDRTIPFVRVGWAVMVPDIMFNIHAPEVIPELVYDERDRENPIVSFVTTISEYWCDRWGIKNPQFGIAERAAIVASIRPDFDIRPSLRFRADRVKEELVRLTDEQIEILNALSHNDRVLVRGSAGTGKTLLAVEEARRLAIGGNRVLLTCFNRALADYLRSTCRDLPGVTIQNFHRVLFDLVKRAGLEHELEGASKSDLYTLFYPVIATKALESLSTDERYDVLIVDEAQDLLTATYAEVMDNLVVGGWQDGIWRVFLDSTQNIFTGLDGSVLRGLTSTRPTDFRLTINCRNTEQIAMTTSCLSNTELARAVTKGPPADTEFYADKTDLQRKVSRRIREWLADGIGPEDIVVLSPVHLDRSVLADGLPGLGISLTDKSNRAWTDIGEGSYIEYRTIGSFKGLEADAVVLVDIEDLVSKRGRAEMYVGASRGRVILAPFIPDALRSDYDNLSEDFGRRLLSSNLLQGDS